MRKRLFLFIFILWIAVPQLYAQSTPTNRYEKYLSLQKKYTIAIQPMQWIFNNGLRLDFEMRLGDSPGWLQLGPTLYFARRDSYETNFLGTYYYDDYGNRPSFREPFSKLRGAGLDVNYKYFFDPKRSVYLSTGLSYNRFDIDYNGGVGKWKEYIQDGLTYHEYSYTWGLHTQHIDRIGINHYFGYQVPSSHLFLFDMFIGVSYRHSFRDNNKQQFNDYVFSYGYTGFVWMTGVRFGIGIKPK